MSLVDFAEKELKAAGLFNEDSVYGGMIGEEVLELVSVFSNQEHSGMSASIVTDIFTRLAQFQPLAPITGADEEWVEVADGIYQNNRAHSIFKENGIAYQSDYYIFSKPRIDDAGEKYNATFQSHLSRKEITFPYNSS